MDKGYLMGYSRSKRKQFATLDLIQGIIDAERDSNPHNVQIDQILRQIECVHRAIWGRLATLNERGGPVFDSVREYQKYSRELRNIQDAIMEEWPGEEVDGRSYVNMVLIYLDQMASVSSRTRSQWDQMVGLLQELYEQMDPGLQAMDTMDKGEQAARTLSRAIEREHL